MNKWRAVSEWMTEDVAWMELLDLERGGFHYNLEDKMAMADKYDTICLKCNGLIARPGVVYGYTGKLCACPDDEKDIEEAVRAEYADYAKQEIRFCPYCGAALGIV